MANSVAVKGLVWNEDRFKEGVDFVKHLYQVDNLFEEQLRALQGFFQGKDLFFSAPTGYGKSLVFHAIPIVADFLMDKLIGTSCIVVVSPLQSLMLDQVSKLKEIGINAAAIYADQSEEILYRKSKKVTSIRLCLFHQNPCWVQADGGSFYNQKHFQRSVLA